MQTDLVSLHVHSWHSDCPDSPYRLIYEARRQGLAGIALTDHDSIGGSIDFEYFAKVAGVGTIPNSVEMSCVFDGTLIHILAFGIQPESLGTIDVFCARANRAMERWSEKFLKEINRKFLLSLSMDNIRILSGAKGTVNPLHVWNTASLLTPYNAQEVSSMILGECRNVFESIIKDKDMPGPIDVLRIIHASGGKSGLAHMELYEKRRIANGSEDPEAVKKRLLSMLEMLVDSGLSCLETVYGGYSTEQVLRQKRIARRYGLRETVGTDYHGSFFPGRPVGMPGMTRDEFFRFKAFCLNE
jgi:3',5'-nucleoside bisphosphate phosphatase